MQSFSKLEVYKYKFLLIFLDGITFTFFITLMSTSSSSSKIYALLYAIALLPMNIFVQGIHLPVPLCSHASTAVLFIPIEWTS